MKFSVILPIFNVENYLTKCIDSVLNQNYSQKNYEIILVDDGSTDSSGKICDEYKKKYTNIYVIHKENGGLSDARNAGAKVAKGDYIFFLDSDDTMAEEALPICSDLITDEDILIGNQNRIISGKSEKKDFPENVYNNDNLKDVLEKFVTGYGIIPWAAYQNIYKTDIIQTNDIYFKKDLVGSEDCEFFFRYLDYVSSFQVSNISMVNYLVDRPDSIMNFVKMSSISGRFDTFLNLFENPFEESKILKEYFSFKFSNVILDICKLESYEDQLKCLELVTDYKYLISYAASRNTLYKIIKYIWIVFGYRNGSKLINKYISTKS